MLIGELAASRRAHHRAVIVDQFTDRTARRQPSQSGEVNGGFGVPGPAKDAAWNCTQRKDVAGASDIGCLSR